MSEAKERLSKEIEMLIERGYYEEAEELLMNNVLPNTAVLFKQIQEGRAAKVSAIDSQLARRNKHLGIAFVAGVAFAIVVALILRQFMREQDAVLLALFGVMLFVPFTFWGLRQNAREDAHFNRSRYERPGYSPRKH